MAGDGEEFYLRYFVEGASQFAGREAMKIEVTVDRESGGGRLRYSNESRYKGADVIRKEVRLSPLVVKELKRIIKESEIMAENDSEWPQPSRENGTQELEIKLDAEHISFTVSVNTDVGRWQRDTHRAVVGFFAHIPVFTVNSFPCSSCSAQR
jgi:protein mago nashi